MLESLYSYKKELENNGIIFSFAGPMSHQVVEGIGNALKVKMEEDSVTKTVTMKVFSIFVEQVQNVINYSDEREPEVSDMAFGIIVIGKEDENFFIYCGNKIKNENGEKLKKNLEELSKMDKAELKEFYKKKRKEGSDEQSKGAGIGFIEMARKSTKPLEFNFEEINSECSFFTIKIVV